MQTFASLKSNSASSLDRLTKQIQKLNITKSYEDDRFWQPEADKSGNGYAIIRFLPISQEDSVNEAAGDPGAGYPWVRMWKHGFQGPGGWYIENSLTTIGQTDPVSEMNTKLWNSGDPKDREIVGKRKRKLTYISNIRVIKDAAHPEKEGQTFLYRYGKKIFDKIDAKMDPEFADDVAVDPFNLWLGCNFKLKLRMVEGYRNYDMSEFDVPSPVAASEEKIETIWKSEYPLMPFIATDKFKSYDELKSRLDQVLGTGIFSDNSWERQEQSKNVAEPKVGKTTAPKKEASSEVSGSDDLDFFRKLAEEDDK